MRNSYRLAKMATLCDMHVIYCMYVATVFQLVLLFLYSNNIVVGLTVDATIPVQTPAVNFTLANSSVS